MVFTEKVHAFLIAAYFRQLQKNFGERGVRAFVYATCCYGEQRGHRMAQRALRDGFSLTYETYCRYGEWLPTKEIMERGQGTCGYVDSYTPDLVRIYTRCPWHEQFREMGSLDAGNIYCKYLDASICRGFNPDLIFIVERTLNGGDACVHRIVHAGVREEKQLQNPGENIEPFEYHCGHVYWTYRKVVKGIFRDEGARVVQSVLREFQNRYGREMTQALLQYEKTDFDSIEN